MRNIHTPTRHLLKRIREIRTAAGVNVLQAAQRAGLMHGSLQRWEKLSVIPRVDTLNRLLEVFGYELIIVRKGRE